MATKSSAKKSASKKVAVKSKPAAKKTAPKKGKATPVKNTKTAVNSKKTVKKTVVQTTKKKTALAVKSQTKKVSKVVNNKAKKAAKTKITAAKPVKKAVKPVKKAPAAKVAKTVAKSKAKVAVAVKKAPAKTKVVAKKTIAPKTKAVAKPVKPEIKNEVPLKPVTKPILKKSTTDAAASQRNIAIRAKYKKVEIEYPVHSAKHILFSYLSTSSGLSEWFADKVNEKGDIMVFEWDGAQQAAKVLSAREDHHIRFRWLDMPEAIYFEFRVETDEITGDLALIITDFCEDESGIESTKNLWNSQIDKLFHVLGIH